jgi:hypothetical protein
VRPFSTRSPPARALSVLALLLVLDAAATWAEKTDIIRLKNGDRITGEVKKLERGRLTVKTDHMGTLQIEWPQVAEVTSKHTFEVETEAGLLYLGSLAPGEEGGRIAVAGEVASVALEQLDVVAIAPIKQTFWGKVDGSLNLGFSATQANSTRQLTFGLDASRRTHKRESDATANVILTNQETSEETRRADFTATQKWIFARRWFAAGFTQLQSNEELGLKLRTLVGGVSGRRLIQTDHRTLAVFAGLAGSRETFINEPGSSSLEAALGLEFDTYTFEDPEIDFTAALTLFPSLTQWGRVRAELNASARRELVKDFFVNLTLLESYDSDPPADAKENDVAVTMSLGWSF